MPDVLRQGRLVATEPGPRDKRRLGHFFAAPIKMANKDYVVVMLVRSDAKSHRMYVHEVALKERLRRPSKTGAAAEVVGLTGSGQAGVIRSIVESAMSFNVAQASRVLDENGEPLVVYHGTGADFAVFDKTKIGRPGFGHGFHFGEQPEVANFYAEQWNRGERTGAPENVMPVYLSIKNPFTGDEIGCQ